MPSILDNYAETEILIWKDINLIRAFKFILKPLIFERFMLKILNYVGIKYFFVIIERIEYIG